MRRIAFAGMKGRKKDTLLLATVIFFSFVFVITAIVFQGSSEKTKIEQRENTFGKWENAYFNGNEEVEERLKNLDNIQVMGESRIVGRSNRLGLVGSIDDELKQMGNFQFQSGGFPKGENEIAIELNQLSNFSNEIKVGDKIPVEIDITLINLDDEELFKGFQELMGEEFIEMFKSDFDNPWSSDPDAALRNYFHYQKYGRNTQEIEHFNGTQVKVIKDYLFWFDNVEEEKSVIENIEENGLKNRERVVLTREMTVSGIINTYSDRWDIDNFSGTNAFITEEAARNFIEGGIYQTKNAQVESYKAPKNFFLISENTSEDFYNENQGEFKNLKRNTYSYPSNSGSADNILTYGILALIFIGTIFSVFQIYLTQMKRRTRKLALLKSIGGTNSQVMKILLWEVLFLLIIIVPLSIIVGLIGVKIIIFIMNNYRGSQTIFYLDVKLVGLGISAAILSVFAGMSIPMIKSMKVPLRGDISVEPSHKKKLTRDILKLDKNHKIKRQSFSQVSKRHNKYNRGKNLLTLSLYTITIVVLLSTIFSGFLSFGEYIDIVLAPNKPDYQFKMNYGMRVLDLDNLVEELKSVKGIENVYAYKYGEGAYLWYEGLENNQIINSYKELLSPNLREETFGVKDDYVNLTDANRHMVTDGFKVSSYGVEVGSSEYNNFVSSVTQGEINRKAFENGEEVIVLMPIYREYKGEKLEIDNSIIENTSKENRMGTVLSESKSYDLSYDFRNRGYYNTNNYLSAGEKIYLTVPTENYKGQYPTNDVRFIQAKVGGIINYFPGKGIWPFSNTMENPVIIGSYKLVHKMYPTSRSGIGFMSKDELDSLVSSLRPTSYGNTLINITTNNDFDEVKGFIDTQRIGNEAGMSVEVLRESNNILKDKALRISIIIGVLGISIALISLIILYNTSLSNIEQEKERIGILQALGVEGDSFKRLYFTTGIKYGLFSIIIAHLFIALVLLATTIIEIGSFNLFMESDFLNILKNKLWMYPWKLHIGICLTFLIWTVITYYLPIRKIVENQAVDNIRSLNR